VLAATQEIAVASRAPGTRCLIQSVTVLDKDDQGKALDLVFLRTNVAIGTENAAVTVSDANADEICGIVEVTLGDYVDLANSQLATKTDVSILAEPASTSTSLFVAAISRGAGTYTAAGITLKIGIIQY